MAHVDARLAAKDYRPWLLPIAGGTLALGFLLSLQAMLELRAGGRPTTLTHVLLEVMPYWILWAAAAPVVLWSTARIRLRFGDDAVRQSALFLVAALGVMLVHSALLYTSQVFFNVTDLRIPVWQGAIALTRWRMPSNLLVYGVLVALIVGRESRRRADAAVREAHERELFASRLVEQLATARLHALRMQLNPHFLFNALNTVAMLVRRGNAARAVQVVAGLSDLLRQLLADTGAAEVTLEQELGFIRQYLAIEQARFGDGLQAEFDITPETLRARVPSLILQPVVENAVRHGAAQAADRGLVRIAASRLDDWLVLEVTDNGSGIRDDDGRPQARNGLGLRNTVERLTHLHGDRFDFELRSDGTATVATITLPFSTTPHEVSRS